MITDILLYFTKLDMFDNMFLLSSYDKVCFLKERVRNDRSSPKPEPRLIIALINCSKENSQSNYASCF